MIAVGVYQPLAVAKEIALSLQPCVKIVGIGVPAIGNAGIDDLDARPVEIDAGLFRRFLELFGAAEKDGRAQMLVHIGDGRPHHVGFLALGEDDPAAAGALPAR